MIELNDTWRFIISSVGKDVEKRTLIYCWWERKLAPLGRQSGSACQNKHYPWTLKIITLLDTFPIKYAHK